MFEKTSVKGDAANPFYARLIQASDDAPAWNFHNPSIAEAKLSAASAAAPNRTMPT